MAILQSERGRRVAERRQRTLLGKDAVETGLKLRTELIPFFSRLSRRKRSSPTPGSVTSERPSAFDVDGSRDMNDGTASVAGSAKAENSSRKVKRTRKEKEVSVDIDIDGRSRSLNTGVIQLILMVFDHLRQTRRLICRRRMAALLRRRSTPTSTPTITEGNPSTRRH